MILPGCSLFKKKTKPEEGPKTTVVGVVEMVNPEQNYVLIRTEQLMNYSAGTELTALDATGVESKIKLTPEKKGRFLTADIVSGQPRVANLVVHKTTGSFNTPAPAPAPVAPSRPVPSATPGAPALAPLPAPLPFSLPMEPAAGFAPQPAMPEAPASPQLETPSGGAGQLEPEVR